jgi:predicted deacylase
MSRSLGPALTASVGALALCSIHPAWGAPWPERIGTAEVQRGAVTRGRLPLIEYADGSDVEAPVIVVAGKKDGPVAWLISCGHGDEVGGALAMQRVAKALDPATMSGLVVLIPVANPPAFQAMRRVNPSPDDLMDFGDAFPGQARFATERIAEKYMALWKEHADFVVDFHTGGDRFVQHPFVIFTVTGTVPTERMESLARMFGVPTLWRDRDKVFESDITINVPAMGIPAFLLEVGGGGVMERQQDASQAEFALSFLRGVRIIPGEPLRPESFRVVEKYRIITPSRGGFFHALVKPGDPVSEGTPLARIVDVYGDEVEILRSPVNGAIVLGMQEFPVVASGSWVAELGILVPE